MNSRVDKFTLQMLRFPESRESGSLTVKRDYPCGISMDGKVCACEVCMDHADLSDTSPHVKARRELRKA